MCKKLPKDHSMAAFLDISQMQAKKFPFNLELDRSTAGPFHTADTHLTAKITIIYDTTVDGTLLKLERPRKLITISAAMLKAPIAQLFKDRVDNESDNSALLADGGEHDTLFQLFVDAKAYLNHSFNAGVAGPDNCNFCTKCKGLGEIIFTLGNCFEALASQERDEHIKAFYMRAATTSAACLKSYKNIFVAMFSDGTRPVSAPVVDEGGENIDIPHDQTRPWSTSDLRSTMASPVDLLPPIQEHKIEETKRVTKFAPHDTKEVTESIPKPVPFNPAKTAIIGKGGLYTPPSTPKKAKEPLTADPAIRDRLKADGKSGSRLTFAQRLAAIDS